MSNLIEALTKRINASTFPVVAVEMSPKFHIRLLNELVQVGEQDHLIQANQSFCGLPILFVHGDHDHCRLLNNTQYNLRIQHNDTLKKYQNTYERSQLYINSGYKINNAEKAHADTLHELSILVRRLDALEKQISLIIK